MPEAPTRPAIPPARDPNRPRPFKELSTASLMLKSKEIGEQLADKKATVERLTELQVEFFRELERRDVSLRAMADNAGVSNVAVSRLLRRHDGRGKEPVV